MDGPSELPLSGESQSTENFFIPQPPWAFPGHLAGSEPELLAFMKRLADSLATRSVWSGWERGVPQGQPGRLGPPARMAPSPPVGASLVPGQLGGDTSTNSLVISGQFASSPSSPLTARLMIHVTWADPEPVCLSLPFHSRA